jgi:hypothetical protein
LAGAVELELMNKTAFLRFSATQNRAFVNFRSSPKNLTVGLKFDLAMVRTDESTNYRIAKNSIFQFSANTQIPGFLNF